MRCDAEHRVWFDLQLLVIDFEFNEESRIPEAAMSQVGYFD